MSLSEIGELDRYGVSTFSLKKTTKSIKREYDAFEELLDITFGIFDRLAFGIIMVDEKLKIIKVNECATSLIVKNEQKKGDTPDIAWLQRWVNQLSINHIAINSFDKDNWSEVTMADCDPMVVHRIPITSMGVKLRPSLLIITRCGSHPEPNPLALRHIYGLTKAEAKLAVKICRGEVPKKIANENRVSVATIRCQLASIFAKTHTCRQSQLAMVLNRVAILP